jgi:hypothetical protein
MLVEMKEEFIFKPITTAGGILTKLILKISGQGKPEPITLVLIGTVREKE